MDSNTKTMRFWQVKSSSLALVFALGGFLLSAELPSAQIAAQSMGQYTRQWGKSSYEQKERGSAPRVTLALSGGGSRGFAHIGVLRALEESNIEIAGIAGTSMGAIIGGLYAVGYTTDEIETIAGNLDLTSLFSNSPRRRTLFLTQRETMDQTLFTIRFNSFKPTIPTELTTAQQVTEMLSLLTIRQNYHAGQDFIRLKIPFKAVATDMESGEAVTLQRGNLSESLRASMAFPLVISAVEIDGRLLVDGGMTKPAPVDLASSLLDGAGFVIAVNTTKELLPREKIDNAFEVANQVTTIMSRRELLEQLDAADFVITPAVSAEDGVDFSKASELAKLGYDASQATVTRIIAIHDSLSEVKKYNISSVLLGGDRQSLEAFLEGLLTYQQPLSEAELDSIFNERWSVGDLLSLTVHTEPADDGDSSAVKLLIEAVEAPKLGELELDLKFSGETASDSTLTVIREKLLSLGKLDIDSLANWLIDICQQRGSDLCRFSKLEYSSTFKTVFMEVDDGLAWHLKTRGLKRTRTSFIRDRTHVHPGEPFNIKSVQDAYRDIYGAGLYKRVSVDIAPTDTGATVTVAVEERSNLQLKLGYRWDDEYHNEGFIETLDDHLFGIGLEVSLRARAAERRKRFTLGLKTDRLFRTFVAFDLRTYISRHDRQLFRSNGDALGIRDEDRIGATLRFSQQIARFGAVSIGSRIESVETFNRPDSIRQDYQLRTLTLSSDVENFDRTYFTQSGRRHILSAEFAEKAFGGSSEFVRWQTMIEGYFPLKERLNFYARFRAAGSSSDLPAAEKYYIGGLDSFEGFRSAELSGAKLLLLNLRLRYRLLPRTYLTLGYNTGATYERTDDVTLDNLQQGWVSTLGFDTPFGPITFGFGRADGGNERVYFNAGLKF